MHIVSLAGFICKRKATNPCCLIATIRLSLKVTGPLSGVCAVDMIFLHDIFCILACVSFCYINFLYCSNG